MDHYRRHKFIWQLLYLPVRLLLFLKFNYRPRIRPLESPCLIVSNHCTDWDPLLLAVTIRNHAYFIASEHIFRKPFTARLLLWLQAPIARMKGTTAGDTALTAVRRLRRGCSIAVFAEGNRTFNGRTGGIVESTAKLARMSGASLATHRFRGGYLSSPRWAGASCRRGKLTGEIVRVYSPAELKAMTPSQIADAIRRDIYEDAYTTQAEWKIPYKGKRLAEHIERAVCICPGCRRMGTLLSKDDTVSCTACGLSAVFTPYGYLEGDGFPFTTVTEWDLWQTDILKSLADSAGPDEPIARDEGCELYLVGDDQTETFCGSGPLSVFRDRFECAERSIPFPELHGLGITGPQTLILTTDGCHYSIRSPHVCNMRKYFTIYTACTSPEEMLSL